MEKSFEVYNDKLKDFIHLGIIIMVFIIVVFIALAIWTCKDSGKLAVISLLAGLCLSLLAYFTSIFPFQRDINNQSYIEYTGEFYVEKHFATNGGGPYIFIKTNDDKKIVRYNLKCDANNIDFETTYYGTFIYAKNSKTVVNIEVDMIVD